MRTLTSFHLPAVLAVMGVVSGCTCGGPPCSSPPRGSGTSAEVCIPGGSFKMGHDKLPKPAIDPSAAFTEMPVNDWAPVHEVQLKAFYIDKFEVTWGRYKQCVIAGICSRKTINGLSTSRDGLDRPDWQDRPVWPVSYDDAERFCTWAGERLPTEAEWERAARGHSSTDFPWGNDPPTPDMLPEAQHYTSGSVAPVVGSIKKDQTSEGVSGLWGGVPEWVSDWYDPTFYSYSSKDNPIGPPGPVSGSIPNEYDEDNWIAVN